MKKVFPSFFIISGLLLITIISACAGFDQATLEGILQNVDSVNGKLTIKTTDGRTINLDIETETNVNTDGAVSAIETLEPGTSVEIEVESNGTTVRSIHAQLAKVEGLLVTIDGNSLTVETERGRQVTVTANEDTRIEFEDNFPGSLDQLQVGREVKIKYDPETMTAFRIYTEEEEAEIEGTITEISRDEITVETGGRFRRTIIVSDLTEIDIEENYSGTLLDLRVEDEIKVKFDPFTRIALKIDLEQADEDDEEDRDRGEEPEDTDRDDDDDDDKSPPEIPHDLAGRDNCLMCHGPGGVKPVPASHVERTIDVCRNCHQPDD